MVTDGHGCFATTENPKGKHIDNPFAKNDKKVTSSFYSTNFPDHIDARALWKNCEPYGRSVDSFIARKTYKLGKRFRFVRFIRIANE